MDFKCQAEVKDDVIDVKYSNTIIQKKLTMTQTTNAQFIADIPDLLPIKSRSFELFGEKFDTFDIALIVQPIKEIHRNV